jgi:hypothetical protein
MSESTHTIEQRKRLQLMIKVAGQVGVPTIGLERHGLQLGSEFLWEQEQHIGRTTLRAIKAQEFYGRLALEAYKAYGPSSLSHGSHRNPQSLTSAYRASRRPAPVLKPQLTGLMEEVIALKMGDRPSVPRMPLNFRLSDQY